GGEAVGLADRCQAREQQVHFDNLAVSGGSEAYAMVLNGQLGANGIQLVANLPAGCGDQNNPAARLPNARPSALPTRGYSRLRRWLPADRTVSSASIAPVPVLPQRQS